MSPITILLTTKGRQLHTLRFIWHANHVRIPYRFLVADGEVHPTIAALLEGAREVFPNLDLTYVRYDDASFSHFYRKLADSSARVTTPYVMISDNDDFPIPSGIDHCMRFLESHAGYVSCGAVVSGFSLYAGGGLPMPRVTGPISRLAFRHAPRDPIEDNDAETAAGRLAARHKKNLRTYYNVHRAPAFASACAELRELDFKEPTLSEPFMSLRSLISGKTKYEGFAIQYLRQFGTSQQSTKKEDWVAHLLRPEYASDFDRMVRHLARQAERADASERAAVEQSLRSAQSELLRRRLRSHLRPRSRTKEARAAFPTVRDFPLVRAALVPLERMLMLRSLKAGGATLSGAVQFASELKAIEETLEGGEFPAFVRRYAPDLLTARGE